jgi:5-methylcytosine-specific restriction protein B
MASTDLVGGYKHWGLPILRALEKLGGLSAPQKIETTLRGMSAGVLTDLQWARLLKGKNIRWAGSDMKKAGLLAGTGEWELTALGRDCLAANHAKALQFPKVAPLAAEDAGQLEAPLETVQVTDFFGYEVPVLHILSKGSIKKKDLFKALEQDLKASLLPGDRRIMPGGTTVWQYRASWCLSNLKKAGEARNPTVAAWEITEAGKARLERDSGSWLPATYQDSKAKVRAGWTSTSTPTSVTTVPPVAWPTPSWQALMESFSEDLLEGFTDGVRPDLGATPSGLRGAIPRNVIFYGPPGTGKTFIARSIAVALTGEAEPDVDGPWAIVQFHPSYSYEDFIQGLRPDLEQRDLRYQLKKGPFLQICEAAREDPDRFFVLVIDEINRGDPARIFGELLYALEYRGAPVDLPLGGQLVVPPNLIVVGTMNSVDRSVALVDYALRRRFSFIRVDPDSDTLRNAHAQDPFGASVAAMVLDTFNAWLVAKLDPEHAIGHSFFLSAAVTRLDEHSLERIWKRDILPLLEEYFFGQPEAVREARKQWSAAVHEAITSGGDDDAVSGAA